MSRSGRFGRLVLLGAAALASAVGAEGAELTARDYGVTADGHRVREFALAGDGIIVRFLDLGGIITAIEVPDRGGRTANVVLGLPDLAAYEARNPAYFFGGIVGRYAGRIANARFSVGSPGTELEFAL